MKTKELKKDLYWVGTLDPDLRVFDIIMETEFGTSYNSYVLRGSEKNVIFEATKAKFFDEYLEKLAEIIDIRKIDYLVVSHTEPDHTGAIERLLEKNPKIKIVGTGTAINFLKEIVNRDFTAISVKEGDTISLGDKTLQFIMAPNLHWPDTMYTYIPESKTLVTCDSFGAHYSCDGITNDQIASQEDYMKALRYYYDMILGPFKSFMLKAIEKIEGLEIETICTGHGPVLTHDPMKVVELTRQWSSTPTRNPRKTVVIPYVSAYGYTKLLAETIRDGILEAGDLDVRLFDMVESDPGQVVGEIYLADGVLFGTPTILGEALKPIWDLLSCLFPGVHGGKLASAFGSYGWSGEGVPNVMERLGHLKMKRYGQGLKVRFKPSDAQLSEARDFGYGFGSSVLAGKVLDMKKRGSAKTYWKCVVCGEIVEGDEPPASCPVCGVGPDQFIEVQVDPVSFHTEKEERFVIIGNGAAGTTACEEIRKRNPVASIHLISRETLVGYNRPMLTKGILSELDMLNFFIKPYSWYQENRVTLSLGAEAASVDATDRVVRLKNGEQIAYDKLILATGAESFVPPFPGVDKQGVFAIRGMADVDRLREYMEGGVQNAVVIGGGVLGLEAAWELKKAGLQVAIVETAPTIMARQLDGRGGEFLQAAIKRADIDLILGQSVEAILGQDRVTAIRLADGRELRSELVVVSTGVRQNVELAREMGLEVGRSIVVNEKMETGKPGVYACGDCAEYQGANYALWPQAVDMGKTSGANAAGDEAVYRPIVPAVTFHGMRTSIFSVGDIGKGEGKKYKTKEFSDEENLIYKKWYFLNGRFCGGILIGDTKDQMSMLTAFEEKTPMDSM